MIYAQNIPAMQGVQLNVGIIEMLLDRDPQFRAGGLRHHRGFQRQIIETAKKMEQGQLQCAHIRSNGKNCPNFNEPGSYYCGLHKGDEEG